MCRAGGPPGQVWEALIVLVLLHPLLKFESLHFSKVFIVFIIIAITFFNICFLFSLEERKSYVIYTISKCNIFGQNIQ